MSLVSEIYLGAALVASICLMFVGFYLVVKGLGEQIKIERVKAQEWQKCYAVVQEASTDLRRQLEEKTAKSLFEDAVMRKLREIAYDIPGWTQSSTIFNLLKALVKHDDTQKRAPVEIEITRETTYKEARTMLGAAIAQHFDLDVSQAEDPLDVAVEFLRGKIKDGMPPVPVFIVIHHPITDQRMGWSGFAGYISSMGQERLIRPVGLLLDQDLGEFMEAFISYRKF